MYLFKLDKKPQKLPETQKEAYEQASINPVIMT